MRARNRKLEKGLTCVCRILEDLRQQAIAEEDKRKADSEKFRSEVRSRHVDQFFSETPLDKSLLAAFMNAPVVDLREVCQFSLSHLRFRILSHSVTHRKRTLSRVKFPVKRVSKRTCLCDVCTLCFVNSVRLIHSSGTILRRSQLLLHRAH